MPEFTVTTEDVKAYVASVPEGEPVGIPQHRYGCLIARTLQWKYPGEVVCVWYDNEKALVSGEFIPLAVEIQNIAQAFDDIWDSEPVDVDDPSTYGDPVTPDVLRKHLPELFFS